MDDAPSPVRLSFAWRPERATAVLLLVHGLGADSQQTWGVDAEGGGFLARLLDPQPPYAVACLDYPSMLGLPGGPSLPDLATLSRGLLATLGEELLPAYDRVAVVAYCLGGLVVHVALADLLAEAAGSVAAGRLLTVLLDAPEDWPDGPLEGSMAAVARMLRVDGPTLRANAAWWSDRAGPAGSVEAHAVVSRDACWVTPFKPGSTASPDRVLRSGLAHLDLARPPASGGHEVYDHVVALLERHLGPGSRAGRRTRVALTEVGRAG